MSTANRPFPRWRVSLVVCVSECESERKRARERARERERQRARERASERARESEKEGERSISISTPANGSHLADREFTDRVYGHTPGPILVEERERERQTGR